MRRTSLQWRLGPRILVLGILAFLATTACEHDPVVLESHPLDIIGSPTRSIQSLYLGMDDGTRIAIDVHVPLNHPSGDRVPTILELTRYWRDRGGDAPYTLRRASRRGFAYVVIDERGTGASFGQWPHPLSERALDDARQVMDWIVEQPWSNGLIGATGVSYPGMAAQQLAAVGHPALRAIVPMSDTYDLYENLVFPGGVFNEGFTQGWSDVVYALDRQTSLAVDGMSFILQPVDVDPNGELLEAAVAGHADNLAMYEAVKDLTFRDEEFLPGLTLDDISTRSHAAAQNETGVAVYQWGSWMDAGSADGVIRQFMESPGPRTAVIGSWTHDLSSNAFAGLGYRSPSVPSLEAQWEEVLNFFDDILRKGKPRPERILRYFTMGENRWKETSTWPIPGTVTETLYLNEGGTLTPDAPGAVTGEDPYEVDFEAQSAAEPRWMGPLFANAWYPDRSLRDRDLLVYDSEPLSSDMEVTGYPVIHLNVVSTHPDGAFFVYLEDVDPSGSVTYVTEGLLRGIHRKVTEDPAQWKRPMPFHSFLSGDASPLVPGQVTELAFGLQPTSFLFRQGHRIRIAIAGQDASAFRQVPADGTPLLRVQRNSSHLSFLKLPSVPPS